MGFISDSLNRIQPSATIAISNKAMQLKAEGRLYFTQEVTEEMLDFVRANPEIESGVRQGSILYHTKIPHMAKDDTTAVNRAGVPVREAGGI